MSSRSETGSSRYGTGRTNVVPFLATLLASLLVYVVTLYALLTLLYSGREVRGEASAGFEAVFWMTLGLHFVLTLAASTLVARGLAAPVLLTTAATTASITLLWVVWFAFLYYQ